MFKYFREIVVLNLISLFLIMMYYEISIHYFSFCAR